MNPRILLLVAILVSIKLVANAQVELLALKAEQQGDSVSINWVTATENNLNYWGIEKSVDGVNFILVDTVTTMGNSTSTKSYIYYDKGPFNYNQCYTYRLKVIYADTNISYSNQVSACYYYFPDIKVFNKPYPNPCVDEIKIAFKDITVDSEINIYLFDLLGKEAEHQVIEGTGNNMVLYIEIHNENHRIRSGTYFLVIYNGKQKIYSEKLILL